MIRQDAEQNTVLAGNPKSLAYYIISKLNKGIPSRGSKEERMGIHLQAWTNI